MTCCGRDVADAISSMSSVDVFEARIASGCVTAVELGEDLLLQLHALEDGFDDDVGLVKPIVGRAWAESAPFADPSAPA